MNGLDFWLEQKTIDDEGVIEGLAAGFGNVDDGGDRIAPGAFAKSLKGRTSLPMLLYHDSRMPAGVWTDFAETPKGLKVKGRFSLSSSIGREAYAMAKDGALAALSIGYRAVREKFEGAVRELIEIKLFEVSLVSVPMNERATITGVKGQDLRDRLAAGDRLSERELETLFKGILNFSNAEAERAVRLHFKKGQGEPGNTASADFARRLHAALVG
jgi:uncharacterized protein